MIPNVFFIACPLNAATRLQYARNVHRWVGDSSDEQSSSVRNTRLTFCSRWLRTGDEVFLDKYCNVHIVDRLKVHHLSLLLGCHTADLLHHFIRSSSR